MEKKVLFFITIIYHSFVFGQVKDIEVNFSIQKDNSVVFNYTKTLPGTYYLKIRFKNINNAFNRYNNYNKAIKNKSGYLFKLKPIDKSKQISFSYSYSWIQGKPDPKIDTSFVYLLPFKEGKDVYYLPITHSVNEYFGEKPPENFFKFLFESDIPDTVCAIRKGIVVSVINEYTVDTSLTYSFSSERNKILIEHKDGTFANYTGFKKDKIFVEEGDIVYPGTNLGVLDKYGKINQYQLRLGLFFLKMPKSDFKSRYKYFEPYFLTSEGIEKIEPKEYYTVKVTDDIVVKEMKRREKKKWKKKHRKKK